MYLLKKVFQLREHAHPDHEKPFLEHLEDLRVTMTRIVVTLVISMVICFSFQEDLMEILRRPVEQVWQTQLAAKLPHDTNEAPRPLGVEQWEEAKSVEHAAAGLDAEQRAAFFKTLGNENLEFHARAAGLLRAAMALPEDKRAAFLDSLNAPPDLKLQVKSLLKTQPSTESNNRGNLRMMSALKPTETFMLSMKLSGYAGVVLAFPLLLLFILQFILPGLHGAEKRVLWPAMAVGFGLFLGGVAFAYFAVLPRALLFFYEWSGKLGVSNDWRIGEYITFATQFTLLFGLSFELPVVVMVFVKLGLLGYEAMSRTRSYAIVAIFVAAAILTPTPDIFTLMLMALPMIILYEICIWLAYFDFKKARRREAEEERERLARFSVQHEREVPHTPPHPEAEPPDSGDDGWTTEDPQHDPHADHPVVTDDWPEIPLHDPDKPDNTSRPDDR